MDPVLLDYLKSGSAWLLVGSGPSIEMGYPTWRALTQAACELSRAEGSGAATLDSTAGPDLYPAIIGAAANDLGLPRLLQHLRQMLRPSRSGETYARLAEWPIPVYLTTNFDDEIGNHLAAVGAHYRTYSNSEDHLALLSPPLTNAIFKLHGDLTTPQGLVLTESQYLEAATADEWEHWRTKLTSVFQMQPTIVVGHSLTDPHVRDVLAAAKKGATVTQPVCWIAPGVGYAEARHYLDKFRIRVIPYPLDASRSSLKSLVRDIGHFLPPRETIPLAKNIAAVLDYGKSPIPAATAIFVFNRLAPHVEPGELRISTAMATLESHVASVHPNATFTIEEAMRSAGWEGKAADDPVLLAAVTERALATRLLVADGVQYRPGPGRAEAVVQRNAFDHLRDRFRSSSDLAFEVLLWNVAASGASPISDATIARVFGRVIDESVIIPEEERQAYNEVLSSRYGESPEQVLARIPIARRAEAALQLRNEAFATQALALAQSRKAASSAVNRAKKAEKDLESVSKYRNKALRREAALRARSRKKGPGRPKK